MKFSTLTLIAAITAPMALVVQGRINDPELTDNFAENDLRDIRNSEYETIEDNNDFYVEDFVSEYYEGDEALPDMGVFMEDIPMQRIDDIQYPGSNNDLNPNLDVEDEFDTVSESDQYYNEEAPLEWKDQTSREYVSQKSLQVSQPKPGLPQPTPSPTPLYTGVHCSQRDPPISTIAPLIPASPLFDGPVNVKTILGTLLDSIYSLNGAGKGVLMPDWNCRNPNTGIADMATSADVPSCKHFGYLEDTEVVIFGAKRNDIGSFCGAYNLDTNTFAIAQTGLPTVKVLEVFDLELRSVGVSLQREFSITSRNKMWDGSRRPNQARFMDFKGHFAIEAADLKFGIKLAKDKVEIILSGPSRLFLDADPQNDGLENPFQAENAVSYANDLDFAAFFQASVTPVVKIKSKDEKGRLTTYEINFAKVIRADVDVAATYAGAESEVVYAGSMKLELADFCQGPLAIVCKFFDSETSLTIHQKAFVNSDGFGFYYGLNGKLSFAFDLLDELGDLINVDLPSIDFDAELGIALQSDGDDLSVHAHGKAGLAAFDLHLAFCDSHSDCSGNSFCEPILNICLPKRPNEIPFGCNAITESQSSGNRMCESGVCVGIACQPCRKVNRRDACGSGYHCRLKDGMFNRKCSRNLNNGKLCLHKDNCKSGNCVNGICSDNCRSHSSCGKGKFCDLAKNCVPKVGTGKLCWGLGDDACKDTHYCEEWAAGTCQRKKNSGVWSVCDSNRVCKSNQCQCRKCFAGICTAKYCC